LEAVSVLPSLNFPQLDFVKPSSGFHPVTWERVTAALWLHCCSAVARVAALLRHSGCVVAALQFAWLQRYGAAALQLALL